MISVESGLTDLRALVNQARVLATGLQHAAPHVSPSLSVQYLFERAAQLEQAALEFETFTSDKPEKEEREKICALIKETLHQDEALRNQYHVGNKFAFLRDRLQVVLGPLEQSLKTIAVAIEEKKTESALPEDTVFYVYLFNAKGAALSSWVSMLTPKLFYEYSVNRPIYADRAAIDLLMKEKPDRRQHAYFSISAKSTDILLSGDAAPKDSYGSPLIKVREGALSFDRLKSFFYNEEEYVINEMGQLVKKI